MRTVNQYVKKVYAASVSGTGIGIGTGTGTDPLAIKLDSDGFPIAPSPASWDKITKDQLEKMYRSYLAIHYGLSSGGKDRQVPFTRIAEKQSAFFAAKYLPRSLRLDDPRNMKRDEIIKFFEHIGSRQASHGVKDAFRFKQFLSSRKKGTLLPAKYEDQCRDSPTPQEEPDPVPELGTGQDPAELYRFTIPSEQVPNSNPAPTSGTENDPTQLYRFEFEPGSVPVPGFGHDPAQLYGFSFQPDSNPYINPANQGPGPGPEPASNTMPEPCLTFDPNMMWESPGNLDPSLDPSFERPFNNGDTSLSLPQPGPGRSSASFLTPTRHQASTLGMGEISSLSPNPSPRRSQRIAGAKRTG